jgi:hypothetical protein
MKDYIERTEIGSVRIESRIVDLYKFICKEPCAYVGHGAEVLRLSSDVWVQR